jgi:hypothetical protein
MLPKFNESGNLPEGIHLATEAKVTARFTTSSARRQWLGEINRTECRVLFDHTQARLRFHADIFWTKASIDESMLKLWLDTYQTGKDFKRRGIVEVSLS